MAASVVKALMSTLRVAYFVAEEPFLSLTQQAARPRDLEDEQREKAGNGVDEDVRHDSARGRPPVCAQTR